MPRLSDEQHEAFARRYIDDFRAIDAALDVGLVPPTAPDARGMANTISNLLMLRPEVAGRIRELNEARLRRVDASAQRTMRALSQISYSDVRRLFREDGSMKHVHEIDDDTAAAIKAVKVERRRVKNGYETDLVTGRKVPLYEDYETIEVKMHDKVATLGILSKHFKIVNDEGDGMNALASVLADRLKGARGRRALPKPVINSEVEDAKFVEVHAQPGDGGARSPVPESGNGDRPDA